MPKAREGRRCWLRNRQSWSGLLKRILTSAAWRSLGEGQPRDGNQARAGWTLKYLVVLSLCIGWSVKRRLTQRFCEARQIAEALYPSDKPLPASYQGFFKQLCKAGVGMLHSVLVTLRDQARSYVGRHWSVHNWIPLGVDGSRIEAPRTESNEEAMGRAGRSKTGLQLWVTILSHLPTGLLWDWRQGPGTASERGHLAQMRAALPDRAWVVGDAGFMSYEVMRAMDQAGQSFLIRCGGNYALLLDEEPVHLKLEQNRNGTPVYLWPGRVYHKGLAALVLRLIVLKRKGKKVYLLTNVHQATELPKWMASEFYEARWGVEVTFRGLKQTMERRQLLSRSPKNAELELAANLLALFLLVFQSIVVLGKQCTTLSISLALQAIQDAMEGLRWGVQWRAFASRLTMAVGDDYQRKRSKQARNWPHTKTDKPPGPPNFRRLTSQERKQLRCLAIAA